MSTPAQDLPDFPDYLVMKDRELHDKLTRLNEAKKHVQGLPKLEESWISDHHSIKKQLAQPNSASTNLEDTGTSNQRETPRSAYLIDNIGARNGGSRSLHMGTASGVHGEFAQQTSHGRGFESAYHPESRPRREQVDRAVASPAPRPNRLEVVRCVKCGSSTGRMPSAESQICTTCKSRGKGSSTAHLSPAPETSRRGGVVNTQMRYEVSSAGKERAHPKSARPSTNGTVTRITNPPGNGEEHGSTPSNNATDNDRNKKKVQEFHQLDKKNWPTVVWFQRTYWHFWCFACGCNVREKGDGCNRPAGKFWDGISGLQSHILGKHRDDLSELGLGKRGETITMHKIAETCVAKNCAQRLSSKDVQRIENKLEPEAPIFKMIAFKERYIEPYQEHDSSNNSTPAPSSPISTAPSRDDSLPSRASRVADETHNKLLQIRESDPEGFNRLLENYDREHNSGAHITTAGDDHFGAQSIVQNSVRDRSEGAQENADEIATVERLAQNNVNPLKRYANGRTTLGPSEYEPDEYNDDDARSALKRQRVTDQTYTSAADTLDSADDLAIDRVDSWPGFGLSDT